MAISYRANVLRAVKSVRPGVKCHGCIVVCMEKYLCISAYCKGGGLLVVCGAWVMNSSDNFHF